jgi:hypothetical protein
MRRRTRTVVLSAGLGVAVLWFVATSISDYVAARRALARSRELRASVDVHNMVLGMKREEAINLYASLFWIVVLMGLVFVAVWGIFAAISLWSGEPVTW